VSSPVIQNVGNCTINVLSCIELGLTNVGIQGPAGKTNIGDLPVVITSPQENDLIQLKSSSWVNVPQANLVDGGNF
jgi:hypothetical protein